MQLIESDWTFDWWIAAEDRIHTPADEASVRQHRLGAGPVVQTSMRVPGGDVHQRTWAYDGGIVLEFENTTATPVGLTLSVRPYDLEGRPSTPVVQLGSDHVRVGDHDVWLGSEARDTVPELDAVIVPLPHKAIARAFLTPYSYSSDRELPESSAAVRGWERLITDRVRIQLPDDRMTSLFDQSRGRLALSTFDLAERVANLEPSAGSELTAVCQGGFRAEAVEVLRWLLVQRWHPRHVKRSEDHRAAAEVMDGLSWALTMYAPKWSQEFIPAGTKLTSTVAKHGTDAQRRLAEGGLARLVLGLGDATRAGEIHSGYGFEHAGPITTLAGLVAHAEAASETGSWGDDDVGEAAVAIRSVRSLIVQESWIDDQPALGLFPGGFPSGWRGGPLEIHELPTAFGDLSAAVRWHGARPALLWEFDRAGHVLTPVELRCQSLDPQWSTTDRKGETLLAGTTVGLGQAPTEGDSFS
ncbi:MAG: hypothetical protein ACN4GZ_02025 [Acidimicrobiales bacterium]